jgi:hypothetical protein
MLVGSGDRAWAYVHIVPDSNLVSGDAVIRGFLLGQMTPTPNADCWETMSFSLVHIAMASITGDRNAPNVRMEYVSMEGQSFCGHPVWVVNGQVTLDGLTTRTGQPFTVPVC